MCGIWALFGATEDVKIRCAACHKISHRGPEAFRIESIPAFPNSCLGFHRLEIVDAVGGMQPMRLLAYPHVRLIYNGEIYNCREVQKEYGFNYESHCDGEAIIHLYIRFGAEKAAEMLDGVFSFVIVDTNERKVFLGRDVFGIRPMFTFFDKGTLAVCSEVKGLLDLPRTNGVTATPFPPGHVQTYNIDSQGLASLVDTKQYLPIGGCDPGAIATLAPNDPHANIRMLLKKAVQKRLLADRRIGCLLSGGLDSSLIAALLVQCMKEEGYKYKVQTFSIGMEGSTDVEAARIMAKHLDTEHHEIKFTPQEGIEALHRVIYALESFDITTIRASVGMYLVSKYVKEKTDTTVIFSGEGSDELCQGYIYFHKAPTPQEGHDESQRLLKDLYFYDVLRSDRTTAAHGLEVRVPFLDKYFTSYYLSLPPKDRQPQGGVEKHLLRSAFSGTGLLPDKILWRPKEAFSDGVSSKEKSWFSLLQDHVENKIDQEMLAQASSKFSGVIPHTKEAYYYRQVFEEMFPDCSHLIPYYWMPKWSDTTDPSARTLNHYVQ